jgi:hypothetical protein
VSLSYTKLVGRDASFQLLRTNPKLTSNIKLVVDGSDNLYLNAIPADTELAKDQYQKYAVDITKSHEFNVFNFYNKGKTPSKIAFKLGSTITQTVTARDLKNQFDFDFYTSGAKYLKSKQYNEKFSYFAPLYLNRIIPDTFVIFKVKGPSNYSAGTQVNQTSSETIRFSSQVTQSAIDEYLQNQSDLSLRREFFKNFQLVKAFDLKPETKIGGYLERIIENPMFPTSPLAINFNSKGFSYYRGLSIKTGTYVELPVDTNSVLTRSLPLLKKEQFIIKGFQDNSILHPNILNLEFVFDDDTAEDFEFNRYFGVYCNRIDLAEFELDIDAVFDNPNDNQQSLTIKYTNDEDIVLPVTNPTGVRVRAKNVSSNVTDLKNAMVTDDNLFFTYVETKSDIHLVKTYSWNQQNAFADFKIDDPSVDLGTFFGPGEVFSQEPAVSSKLPSRSTLAVKVLSTPTNASSFNVYHTNGTYTDTIGKYDPFTFILSSAANNGSFAFNEPGKWSVEYLANGQTVIYISADGDKQDIAAAIAGAVNDLQQSDIQAVSVDEFAFIQIKAFGESIGQLKAQSSNPALKLIGSPINGLIYADGGTLNPYPIIDNNQINEDTLPLIKINENKDQLIVKTETNWSRISRIARPTSLISPMQADETLAQGKTDFLSKATILLKDNEVPYIAHGNIEIRKIAKNKVGVLSIFDIKDFDFGITKTDYARFDKIDLFKDFYEPANVPSIDFRKYVYRVIGNGKIVINETIYNSGEYVWQDKNGLQLYSLVEGDCAIIKTSISPNAFINLLDGVNPLDYPDLSIVSVDDDELKDYTGQFSIRTPFATALDQLDTTYTELSEYRNRYLTGVVDSEYLVYKEEQSTEFAIDNKITPYIAKWGLKDSIDGRSNPYRLNADLIFGKDNFGPSHTEVLPVPEKLTHEWFYIESDFGFNSVPETMYQNYSYFEEKFNFSRFVTEAGYFDEYFNYVPTVNSEQIDRVQLRYSDLFKDPYSNQYETVFKGVKYRFFELDQALLAQNNSTDSALKTNTDRFKDYRFSALLVPIEDQFEYPQTPARFEIVENTDAKAIIVLIYVALASAEFLNPGVRFRDAYYEPKVFNQSELLSITPAGNILFTELYGDYRVQYNQFGVSNITHSFLYYAKNKKYNAGQNSYSTTRLAKNVDLSFTGFQFDFTSNTSSSVGLTIPIGLGYDTPIESQISILPGQYSPLVMFKPTGQNFESQIIFISNSGTDLVSVATNPILSVSQDVVQYTDSDMYAIEVLNTGTLNQNLLSQLPTGSQDQWRSLYYTYQISGGANYYEKLFQYFSFANFKFLLDSKESVITWKSFTGGNLATTQQFTIRAVDPSPISVSTVLVNLEQKVTSNSRSVTGGYAYDETAIVPLEIHRYSGEYDVVFKPVSAFYQNLQINGFTISGANCSLHISVPNFFVVPEFYHVKYSKSQLLDLENSQEYSPIYPTISETPIGVAPYNILNSSWDKDYHFEYVDKSTYSKIFGTRRITEDYAFVSKLINVPETLHLDEFYISQVNQAQFRSLAFSNMVEYADYAKNIRFKIDFAKAVAVGFKNKGLYAEFAKFFSDQNGATITSSIPLLGELTLDQYTEEYAKANLQALYKVDEVEIWQKVDKTIPNGTVVLVSKTLDQFINEGYTQTKNVRINNQNPTILEGAIDKPINSGLYVGFRIKIKFI